MLFLLFERYVLCLVVCMHFAVLIASLAILFYKMHFLITPKTCRSVLILPALLIAEDARAGEVLLHRLLLLRQWYKCR